jgi:predicted ATPase
MISSVRLRNYKCFADVTVRCAPLTLLAGINGAGKSSLIQALLLLRQSWDQKLLGRGLLALNGDLTQVGTAKDALYGYSEEDRFGFDVAFVEGERSEFEFIYDRSSDVLTASKTGVAAGESIASRLERESLFGSAFYYLAAERVGPRVSSPTAEFLVRHNRQIGTRGEYAVQSEPECRAGLTSRARSRERSPFSD